jgi:hypothetical protein
MCNLFVGKHLQEYGQQIFYQITAICNQLNESDRAARRAIHREYFRNYSMADWPVIESPDQFP